MFVAILRQRHWALLWAGQVCSAVGDHLYTIALMWLAVRIAGSAAGLVAAAETGALLLFGLLGGVYADRWDRRRTMIVADLLRAAAVATLSLAAWAGELTLWHLGAVAGVLGALTALFDPALQASLPALAGDARTLQSVNGLMDVTRRVARTIGPSLAGALTALMPITHLFTIDAVTFVVSALAIAALGRRWRWRPGPDGTRVPGLRGVLAELRSAGRALRAHRPLVWGLASHAVGGGIAWSAAFTVGVPLLTERVLHGGAGDYGLIVGAYGAGNVLSNLVVASLRIRRRVVVMFTGRALMGLGFLVMAGATTLPLALAGAALAAIGGPMGDIVQLTMIQTDLPSHQIGKVYSLRMIVTGVGSALGLVVAGPLFTALGVPAAIALCGALSVVVGLAGLARFGLREPAAPALALAAGDAELD
ncbi:MAG: MFS transporter [Sphaerobacter sp.]|nr:MFS transporter [Sphaerobacter sp.]